MHVSLINIICLFCNFFQYCNKINFNLNFDFCKFTYRFDMFEWIFG
jgi:hypothetical protein